MKDKIRLYIVDDERMAIAYFKSLVKEASPAFEVVGEAYQGAMAFSQIRSLRPDIIFVDISMPVMNGLQLSEKLLMEDKSLKIVLLTSYRDFDYVKKGMELGVTSYMLKNELTKESLENEIQKIAADILLEKKKSHTYAEYNVRNFLTSKTGETDTDLIYSHQPMQRFGLLYISRDCQISLEGEEIPTERVDVMGLEELSYEPGVLCRNAVSMSKDSWCGIFFLDARISDSIGKLKLAAAKIRDFFRTKAISVTIIVSPVTRKFAEVPALYQEVWRLSGYSYSYGREQILLAKEFLVEKEKSENYEEALLRLAYTLDEEDVNASQFQLQQMLHKGRTSFSYSDYIRLLQDIRGILRRYAEKKTLELTKIYEKGIFQNVEEGEAYLEAGLEEIYKRLNSERDGQHSRMIGQCLKYIHENYSRNISVKDIAGAAGISDGHLRKCFKNELHITVVDYLTSYRIRRAKKLMKSGECRISEIYEKVGFTSSQYFSYVFKKLEGVTPGEFLKKETQVCGDKK